MALVNKAVTDGRHTVAGRKRFVGHRIDETSTDDTQGAVFDAETGPKHFIKRGRDAYVNG